MNKQIKKFDDWMYRQVTVVIRRWVKKKKFQKHKYDFILAFLPWEKAFFFFSFIVPVALAWRRHSWAGVAINLVVLGVLFALTIGEIKVMTLIKEDYDFLFLARKDPMVYGMVKELCELGFKEGFKLRTGMIKIQFVMIVFSCVFFPWALPLYFIGIFRPYVHHVFDFDEPDNRKEPKKSLSEVLQKAYKNLIGGLNPNGA